MVNKESHCHIRVDENGLLYCPISEQGTTSIDLNTCRGCKIGEMWRKYWCDKIYGKTGFMEYTDPPTGTRTIFALARELYCRKKRERISFDTCENCDIRDEAEVEIIVREALSYLESKGFEGVVSCIKDAREALSKTDRKTEDNEVVITHVAAGLEETLIRLIPKYGLDLPRIKTLGKLWNTFKTVKSEELYFNEVLHSIIPILTTIRNKESRSHISERTPTDAETYFYYSLSIIIIYFLVRSASEEGIRI